MTKTISVLSSSALAVALLATALPARAHAQIPQASATALGMGFNMTAAARGFAAIANNPAGLGHPSSPGFSLAIPAVAVQTGLGPVKLGELADWEGQLVPDQIKSDWLQRIVDEGGQSGSLAAGLTGLAMSVGPFGLQAGLIAGSEMSVAPGVAELLLYGNAGRTGSPGDFALADSEIDGFALSTVALSFGTQVSPSVYVGATGTYIIGNGLLIGRDAGGSVSSDPLGVELQFPMILPRTEEEDPAFENGTGVGLDVGALWEGPTLTLGATVQNMINTFDWDLTDHVYRAGEATYDAAQDTTDFDERPISEAPASLLEIAADRTIKPVLAVGAEWRPSSLLRLQGDIRKRVSGGLEIGPEFHAGVGAELRALSFLPLRAHLAVVTGGVQVGGGASLVLGPVNLTGAGALRTGDGGDAALGMFTLSFGAN